VFALREKKYGEILYTDRHVDDEDPIQVSKFWVPPGGEPTVWFDHWETVLQSRSKYGPAGATGSRSSSRPSRAQQSRATDTKWIFDGTVGFEGIGFDEENFYASGFLNPLPAQRGIPGWQRMTMMEYFRDEHGSVDHNALWAYEGVVLPGGQIMVGRWWAPENVAEIYKYSGPIIMWCVDQSVSQEYRDVSGLSIAFSLHCLLTSGSGPETTLDWRNSAEKRCSFYPSPPSRTVQTLLRSLSQRHLNA
jgi:hypothetical protein